MKTQTCPTCKKEMYLNSTKTRWQCVDSANCARTLKVVKRRR